MIRAVTRAASTRKKEKMARKRRAGSWLDRRLGAAHPGAYLFSSRLRSFAMPETPRAPPRARPAARTPTPSRPALVPGARTQRSPGSASDPASIEVEPASRSSRVSTRACFADLVSRSCDRGEDIGTRLPRASVMVDRACPLAESAAPGTIVRRLLNGRSCARNYPSLPGGIAPVGISWPPEPSSPARHDFMRGRPCCTAFWQRRAARFRLRRRRGGWYAARQCRQKNPMRGLSVPAHG